MSDKYIGKIIMSENGTLEIRKYYEAIHIDLEPGSSKKRTKNNKKINHNKISTRSVRRTRKKLYELIDNNLPELKSFITLTFEEEIDDYDKALHCLNLFFRRVKHHARKLGIEFKYIGVAEIQEGRAKKCGKSVIHFHLITNLKIGSFFLPKKEKKSFYSSTKKKWIHMDCYDIGFWTYGFSYAEEIQPDSDANRLTNYLAKYMGKSNSSALFGKRKLLRSRNLKSNVIEYISNENELKQIIEDYEPYLVKIDAYSLDKGYFYPYDSFEYQLK